MNCRKKINVILLLSVCIANSCGNPDADNKSEPEETKEDAAALTHVRQIGKNKLRVYYTGDPDPALLSFVSAASDGDAVFTNYAVLSTGRSEINGKKHFIVTLSPDLVVNDKLIVSLRLPPSFEAASVCYRHIWPWDDDGPL